MSVDSNGTDRNSPTGRARWRSEVLDALAAMPITQRAVLEAAYFAGQSQAQIVERLNLTPQRVRSLMATGLRDLAHALTDLDAARNPHVRI